MSGVKFGYHRDFPEPGNPEPPSFYPQVGFFYMEPPKSGGFHQSGAEPRSDSVTESSRSGEDSKSATRAGT